MREKLAANRIVPKTRRTQKSGPLIDMPRCTPGATAYANPKARYRLDRRNASASKKAMTAIHLIGVIFESTILVRGSKSMMFNCATRSVCVGSGWFVADPEITPVLPFRGYFLIDGDPPGAHIIGETRRFPGSDHPTPCSLMAPSRDTNQPESIPMLLHFNSSAPIEIRIRMGSTESFRRSCPSASLAHAATWR